jgi:hypothetical protein
LTVLVLLKIGAFPRRGYRFVAEEPQQPGDRGAVVGIAAMRRRSVLSSGNRVLMTYINEPAAIPRLKNP